VGISINLIFAAKSWGMPISNGAAIAYARIPLTAQTMAELEEKSKTSINEWETYIETSRDVRLVTLIRFHQTTDSLQWACNFSKFLLILIFVIQLIVPIVMAISAWRDYDSVSMEDFFQRNKELQKKLAI
jgi:hypothetical protein